MGICGGGRCAGERLFLTYSPSHLRPYSFFLELRVAFRFQLLSKLKSTYTDKLPAQVNPETGRVHTSYHQAVAATGRLSSSDPNLQNIPIRTEVGRRIRQAFIAPPDCRLVAADYSQIELRVMAHLSGDAALIEAFLEPSVSLFGVCDRVYGSDKAGAGDVAGSGDTGERTPRAGRGRA